MADIRFTQGEIEGVLVGSLKRYADERGWLIECFRTDELDPDLAPPMAYVSLTHPGVVRGPHEHRDQADNFAMIGPSTFKVFLWDSREDSPTFGKMKVVFGGEDNPVSIVVPAGVVHAYKNVGTEDGLVFNAPNRLFAGEGKREPVDEIRHEDDPDSPYVID
jgi:dTDP-4-dehydrorhamnose 3,5-epimerase